jgi:hypothetical protein
MNEEVDNMSQKWITKKNKHDENIHIPIKDRKPFGIPREKALIDVEKLREMGKRARLIETNRKRKLYAPYKSAIDQNGNLVIDVDKDNEEQEDKNKIEKMDLNKKMLYYLGLINENGKTIAIGYEKDGINNVIVENGKITFLVMNPFHTTLIKEIIPNIANLNDGDYVLDYDKITDEFKLRKRDKDDIKITFTGIDHKNAENIYLDRDKLKEIKNTIKDIENQKDASNPVIVIRKDENSNKVKMEFYKQGFVKPEYFIKSLEIDLPQSDDKKIYIGAENKDFFDAINILTKNKKTEGINLKVSSDIPLVFYKNDPNIERYVYVAHKVLKN